MNNKFLALLFLSAISLSSTAAPTGTATIYGIPYYPSEYIPAMTVYATSLSSGETYSVDVPEGALQYKIKLPAPDSYVLFSWTKDKLLMFPDDPSGLYRKVGALYSHCSAMTSDAPCDNYSPKAITLTPNQVIRNFKISDTRNNGQVPVP